MMIKALSYIISLTLLCTLMPAQNAGLPQQQYVIEDGDEYFAIHNYQMALSIYKEILKSLPYNREVQYKIASCYLNTNINRQEATKYLEFVVKEPEFEPEAWYDLGYVYQLAYKFDDAIAAFEKYKELVPKKANRADRRIEMCHNAQTLMKTPVNVSFTNLGKDLNSEYPDYYPWINKDETFIVFTSRRKGNIGGHVEGDGYYSSDIYSSQAINGKWNKSRNIGPAVNTALDEQVVGLKPDGTEMLVYLDHIEEFGNLYISKKKGAMFQKIVMLPEQINKKIEHSGSISEDGNTIFFVRKEKEKETTDIYMCRKLPSGEWAQPQKLDDHVNTPYNEDFPYLAIDGKTLYFSSEGHNSMGGFDLYKSEWDSEHNTWSRAVNLGYPVNTTDDDRSISLSADNRVGYISAIRPGGYGDLDIYRIKFNDAEQKVIIYKGQVAFNDSTLQPGKILASITATNKTSEEEYTFATNPQNGNFVLALPAGQYAIHVSAEGYADLNDVIQVSDIGSADTERKKEFRLEKK
ncbi:MAG: PD40 domain-containing protein [Bacteroidetes bacterium]|nr:PD40 domain-containing protein [Bacteroidota bacterium]